jgi:uncharacterized membrane protein YsdA (DUF1294 family)
MDINLESILIAVFAFVNLVAFFIIAYDKLQARRGNNSERVSEGVLFFMATVFGGVGVYAGMLAFRHKTKKWYFQLGIPLLIAQNLAVLYMLRELFLIN